MLRPLLAFPDLVEVTPPGVLLGATGGLLGVADGVFLKVGSAFLIFAGLERFRSLPA